MTNGENILFEDGLNHSTRYLSQIFSEEKPLAWVGRTGKGHFFIYDSGTNRLMGCNENTGHLVHHLLSDDVSRVVPAFISRYSHDAFTRAVEDIREGMEKAHIFKIKKVTDFRLAAHFQEDMEKKLENRMDSITLELTEECNLRCRYCVYNSHVDSQRGFSARHMSTETARKAIDFLNNHSSQQEEVTISFYGGEPIMRFPFMRECVRYSREMLHGKTVKFALTTNGTLIDPETAEFLMGEDFTVLVSLDGPRKIHDAFRVDREGGGSFERTVGGLRLLAEKHRATGKGLILLNMVYTPPYYAGKLDEIREFLNSLDWLPLASVTLNYPGWGTIPADMMGESRSFSDIDMDPWALKEYRRDFLQSDTVVRGIIEMPLARLVQRYIYTESSDGFYMNGCCLPGQRKMFIRVDGSMGVCEKMPADAPGIGHVDTGFDIETIKRIYTDDYAQESLKDCAGCWAVRLCDLCYFSAFNDKGELDMGMKRERCRSKRSELARRLCYYVDVLSEQPGEIKRLKEIELK